MGKGVKNGFYGGIGVMEKMLRDDSGGNWKRKEFWCEQRMGHNGSGCCHIAGV